MRFLIAFLLLATSALAASWTPYANVRYGIRLDIPPGFVNDVPPPANGDGLAFHTSDREAELLVWGNDLAGSFKEEALGRAASEKQDRWLVTYERGNNLDLARPGAGWYVYSGAKDGRIVYAKAVASCRGTQAIHFRIEYPEARKSEFNDIVSRLAISLRAGPSLSCKSG
ncbi:MAG: hypothetical protein HY245_07230 [Rhizobiales bacterium]|nr:hypothetical protein [Hyphomicrobiales bacterium]MBI3673196.1 hypothetical protein [Hyphomicrobiales bacterium]